MTKAEVVVNIPKGQIFSVVFIKRTTGEVRRMVCRRGVKKHASGGGRAYDPKAHQLLLVFDMQKEAYRTIPLEGIREITTGGICHHFEE